MTIDDYTQDLRALAERAAHGSVAEAVERALDGLSRVVPYDLAAVLQRSGDRLSVRYAHGPLADERVAAHSIDLSTHPVLQAALEEGRPLAVTEDVHDSEGDPYDGVLDLPHGHSCMVLPLRSGDQPIGAITLDRTTCEVYPSSVVELASAYADIVALVIACAEQSELLDRYRRQLEARNQQLLVDRRRTTATEALDAARSPAMRALTERARRVAATASPVLVNGETGSGKEVLARAIHDWSPRRDAPFVAVNCAAIPENLVESELFGHVRGAFTGADRDRPGRFLSANGGTLLLDEIGDLPLPAQGKLLRVLQEGSFEAVGSDRTVRVDVRVIAATHVDLQEAIGQRRFREDLYYRLAVFPLRVPPLRERREDIVGIARTLLDRLEARGGGPWTLSTAAARALEASRWPGNVRELANTLERWTILQPHGVLRPEPTVDGAESPLADGAPGPLEPVIRAHIEAVLAHTGGQVYGEEGAAAILGLAPSTLQARMRRLGIDHRRFRPAVYPSGG